jgi:hypothetical protein
MRWSIGQTLFSAAATMFTVAAAERALMSQSLNICQDDSMFSASLFDVKYTPGDNKANFALTATSSVQGKVTFDISITAYGYQFLKQTIDPCDIGKDLGGLCPMNTGPLDFEHALSVPGDAASQIPGIAYTVPDIDAKVRVYINLTGQTESIACVEADFSNGKTVDLLGVKWATAIIAGLGLISSAIVSGLGHSNTASHIAANSLSLFAYFQGQAIVGLTAVPLPPIVQSWTQNFQWSMGIINVGFMQTIFTWYQRATGGDPGTLFDNLGTKSVQVEKRALALRSIGSGSESVGLFNRAAAMMPRSLPTYSSLAKRANIVTESGGYLVYGIQRVAYRSKIESTNLFLTGLVFFILFVVFTILIVAAFKGILELCAKRKWISGEKFAEFRNGWLTILKGILFRATLIGFPQMCILCTWEFTQKDSPALVVLAVFFLLGMIGTLGWGSFKVISIARRSVTMHRNPAYILFSDPQALNKWGFLYIQYRASAYYFVVPTLVYTFIKALFVSLAQGSGIAQAIGFIIIEAGALIAASVLRPWMDKSTNSFNISICAVNFVNSIFLLLYTNVFGAPALVVGVVGVIFFVLNAVFALVLLLMIIISTTLVFFRKNPDARYQFMADDRASFMKSQSQLNTTTELDALAATARGDKSGYKHMDMDDDESLSATSMRRRTDQSQMDMRAGARSPVNPSMPLFPAARPESPFRSASPSPYNASATSLGQARTQHTASPASFRQQNNAR